MILSVFDDGAPCAVKAARTVWGGGKSGDDFKGLPIVKSVYPAGLARPGWHTSVLYLGGNEAGTHKYISESLLGKSTIDTRTSGQSKGKSGSYTQNFQNAGRELMTPDEARRMDNRDCLLFIRGELPILDRKYDLMKHPNIRLTEDGGAAPYRHNPETVPIREIILDLENPDDYEIL